MDEIAEVIRDYRPILRAEHWSEVAPWVRSVVTDASPATRGPALIWLDALTRWAIDQGLPLNREVLLCPATVEQHTTGGMAGLSDTSRGTRRSYLSTIGRRVTTRAP